MIGFNAPLRPRRPVRVERHVTAAWGWRWSCARCGKAATRIPTWLAALEQALTHECEFRAPAGGPTLETASPYWTRANAYFGNL